MVNMQGPGPGWESHNGQAGDNVEYCHSHSDSGTVGSLVPTLGNNYFYPNLPGAAGN